MGLPLVGAALHFALLCIGSTWMHQGFICLLLFVVLALDSHWFALICIGLLGSHWIAFSSCFGSHWSASALLFFQCVCVCVCVCARARAHLPFIMHLACAFARQAWDEDDGITDEMLSQARGQAAKDKEVLIFCQVPLGAISVVNLKDQVIECRELQHAQNRLLQAPQEEPPTFGDRPDMRSAAIQAAVSATSQADPGAAASSGPQRSALRRSSVPPPRPNKTSKNIPGPPACETPSAGSFSRHPTFAIPSPPSPNMLTAPTDRPWPSWSAVIESSRCPLGLTLGPSPAILRRQASDEKLTDLDDDEPNTIIGKLNHRDRVEPVDRAV